MLGGLILLLFGMFASFVHTSGGSEVFQIVGVILMVWGSLV